MEGFIFRENNAVWLYSVVYFEGTNLSFEVEWQDLDIVVQKRLSI